MLFIIAYLLVMGLAALALAPQLVCYPAKLAVSSISGYYGPGATWLGSLPQFPLFTCASGKYPIPYSRNFLTITSFTKMPCWRHPRRLTAAQNLRHSTLRLLQ